MTELYGQQTPEDGQSSVNATIFAFQQLLSRIQTMSLVQVLAVSNAGGVAPTGTVDVQIAVGQVDGIGNVTPHGTIYSLPYQRIAGGTNAIILDPQIGDFGAAGFCSRDISAVKASKAISGPGSKRRFNHSDGLYFGSLLSGSPVQYIQFTPSGITVVSPMAVTVQAPTITLNASTSATITSPAITLNGDTLINGHLSQGTGSNGGTATLLGPLGVTNDVTAAGISVKSHTHGGVQTGSGRTSVPA